MLTIRTAKWLLTPVLIGLLLVTPGCKSQGGGADIPALELTFEFDDRAGIDDGDLVMLRGFEVGTVHSVSLKSRVSVAVRVSSGHRDAVLSACYGRIVEPTVGSSFLEIVILDSTSPAIADGSVRPGATTDTEAAWLEGKHHARQLTGKATDSLVDEAKRIGGMAKKAAGRAVQEAGELSGAARERAAEAVRTIRDSDTVKDGAEAVKRQAQRLKDLFD
ncbi:MAG: ABC-type transporter Mla subunit MlaD [Myxococcota bacterium]|jgi:ABC-type transporter Mla subunit MlaD